MHTGYSARLFFNDRHIVRCIMHWCQAGPANQNDLAPGC